LPIRQRSVTIIDRPSGPPVARSSTT